MEERIQENLKFVYERVDQFWSLVHEDGDMKVKNSEKKKIFSQGQQRIIIQFRFIDATWKKAESFWIR